MKRYIRNSVNLLNTEPQSNRRKIAKIPQLSTRDLSELLSDSSESVRMDLAKNPNISLSALTRLIGDDYSTKVSDAAISNKSITPEVLISLVDTAKPIVQRRIASSCKTPTAVLRHILKTHKDSILRNYASEELSRRGEL